MSREALAAARDNADRPALARAGEFTVCDFGAALTGIFDLVVSNPPYIASADIDALSPEVRHDPRPALDGGPDGLDCYRAIAGQAPDRLKPNGDLVVELGIGQEPAVATVVPHGGAYTVAGTPRSFGITCVAGACCHNDAMTAEHCG